MGDVQQRSLEWFEQRRGKFTASETFKIMGVRGLGETGNTFALEKAIELVCDPEDDNFVSSDMQRGIDLEPLAFAKFKELKEVEFLEVENCGFFEYCENSGASPDGLVSDDAVLEIKCPKKTTFFKLVATNEIDSKYYAQMQLQMMATNRNRAHFFNYLVHEGMEYWHEIIVERDEVLCDKIKERIKEAVEIKNEYINKLNNNKQW
jgi:exodeoxyribonuclease (lambda-induced)